MTNLIRTLTNTPGSTLDKTNAIRIPISSANNTAADYILLHKVFGNTIVKNILMSSSTSDATLSVSICILPGDIQTYSSIAASIALDSILSGTIAFSTAANLPTIVAKGSSTLYTIDQLISSQTLSADQKIAYGRSPNSYWVALKVNVIAAGTPNLGYYMDSFTTSKASS